MEGGGGREGASNDTPCGSATVIVICKQLEQGASDFVHCFYLANQKVVGFKLCTFKTLNQVGTIYHMGRNTRKPVFGVFWLSKTQTNPFNYREKLY